MKKIKSKKELDEEKLQESHNKFICFILIILVMFIFIMIVEVIFVNQYIKRTEKYVDNTTNNTNIYDTSTLTYTNLTINDNNTSISDICSNGCNLKINYDNKDYFYLIDYNDSIYKLTIVLNNNIIVKNKNIGNNINNAYMRTYSKDILFYNLFVNSSFSYDYVNVVKDSSIDEFISLEANEMEFLDDGIIYYYDICEDTINGDNAYKVKAIRLPFSTKARELSRSENNYSWCNKE